MKCDTIWRHPYVELDIGNHKLFHQVVGHLGKEQRTDAVNGFFRTLLPATDADALFNTLDGCRPPWPEPPGFRARLKDFLWNPGRLGQVENEARSFFHQL